MTIPPRDSDLLNDRLELPRDYPDEREPFGVDRVIERFRNPAVDAFDPELVGEVPPEGSAEEAVERLARTPASAEATTEAPALMPARLGPHDGLGLLRLLRDASGTAIRAHGTWRSGDGRMDLSTEMPVGSTQRFEGTLHDDAAGDEAYAVTVTVTGHGDYRDTEGLPLRLVRFVAPDAVEAADRPLTRAG